MTMWLSRLYKLLAVVAITTMLLIGATAVFVAQLARTPMSATDVLYVIPRGMSFSSLARDLDEKSYIENARLFHIYRWWLGTDARLIQTGEYRIPAGMLPGQFLKMIGDGDTIHYSFTIIPGSTTAQVLDSLRSLDNIRFEIPAETDVGELMSHISQEEYRDRSGEGMFYADSYHYQRGSSDIELLQTAHQLLLNKLDEHCPDMPANITNAYQALTLASIVEKESGSAAEYGLIAGVFLNRLRDKMRLEADPTVIYGLGDEYQGDIKRVHLRTDTEYNTYTRHGLPPTPIANVEQRSLMAVCQPVAHDFYYFVADGTGGHVFNTKYKEHQKAVRRYIRTMKNRQ